ncbi:FAD-dependent oxidoreductase [Corynebacterium mendelii]|uniref:FAD-dependent oxidoreductase n=1 Tax=Corynebacterium mendelii TaxID=2765362 RepID=A0A939E0X6_9CORY|nr:FAD-dependent oxidoreductase [Corynebacterium mendelii]MBN9644399.1 FAD-dependent oxidoreductase [Corynebacterium mendelii]
MDADVVVVGAGAAGVAAAIHLAQAGREVLVLEAADHAGGRAHTRTIDGFLLDEGFHTFNPVYPENAMMLDIPALDLHPLAPGLAVKDQPEAPLALFAKPGFNPLVTASTLVTAARQGMFSLDTARGALRWMLPAINTRSAYPFPGDEPDMPLSESLDRAGFPESSKQLLIMFFAGVLGEDKGESSATYAKCMLKAFTAGQPSLPVRGIGMIAEQLVHRAQQLGVRFCFSTAVAGVDESRADRPVVAVVDGDSITANHVVIATDAVTAADTFGSTAPAMRGLSTWWYAADEPPEGKHLTMDPHARGPLVNTVVMSNTNPNLAPVGKHLVQASAIIKNHRALTDREALDHMSFIWGMDPGHFELIVRDDIVRALPTQLPGREPRAPQTLRNVVFAGDWCHSATLNGALVSGRLAAGAVLRANNRSTMDATTPPKKS